MALYQSIVAYDGSGFEGFQRQAGARTVQGVLEAALRNLGWEERAITFAGRTDAGVHALGQVVAFSLAWRHGLPDLLRALNAHLPRDVAVWQVRPAAEGFHPRYGARARRYVYRVRVSPVRHPLQAGHTWRVWPPPEPQRLHRAAQALVGRRDFRALGTPPRPGGTTVRTVFHAAWYALAPGEWAFDVIADAFLYHMVRRMVALQVAVAQGRMSMDAWLRALETPPAEPLQGLAPPQGLYLARVYYTEDGWEPPGNDEEFRTWWQRLWSGPFAAPLTADR